MTSGSTDRQELRGTSASRMRVGGTDPEDLKDQAWEIFRGGRKQQEFFNQSHRDNQEFIENLTSSSKRSPLRRGGSALCGKTVLTHGYRKSSPQFATFLAGRPWELVLLPPKKAPTAALWENSTVGSAFRSIPRAGMLELHRQTGRKLPLRPVLLSVVRGAAERSVKGCPV